MSVDFDLFVDWCERRFGNIKVRGKEVMINSVYDPDQDDTKYKLWCRPDGSTKKGERDNGVYHCWISGKKGTLVGLVMDVDKCSYEEACEILGADGGIQRLEEELEAFFAAKKPGPIAPITEPTKKSLTMPDGVVLITSLTPWNRARKNAEWYLANRKIPVQDLYIGLKDEFRERVVIPYYDRDGDLIYYNGRYIGPSDKPAKYRGPDKSIGVGKGDVVYMPHWHEPGTLLHITEGEFDAMVLSLCGLASCAVGGSHLTEYQRKILRDYRICLCGDNDKPGMGAIMRTGMQMLEEGFKNIRFVHPPEGYKDWNELYIKIGPLVKTYVEGRYKPFDVITAEQLFLANL
jgi:hypothetical protein